MNGSMRARESHVVRSATEAQITVSTLTTNMRAHLEREGNQIEVFEDGT
jgi:hypothetical protein